MKEVSTDFSDQNITTNYHGQIVVTCPQQFSPSGENTVRLPPRCPFDEEVELYSDL